MLTRLIDLCLRHRPIVLLVWLLIALSGLASLSRMAFDAFPDTTPVQVQINTTAPAFDPLEIERQITYPIEQSISGLPGLTEVRSISKFGFSQVTAIFEDGTDIYAARQVVNERVAVVRLPDGIEPPAMGPVATGLGEVFHYLITSETLDVRELRTLHHWVIRPQMVRVPGIAEINTWGGLEKQYHVIVDPDALIAHELTLDDVARVLSDGNRNAGGGIAAGAGETRLIQGRGLAAGLEDLRRMVVAQVDGTPIHLDRVAEVSIGHEIRRGAVTADGEGEVVLGLGFMLMGENSREITEKLEARLAEVQTSLPDTVRLEPVYTRLDLVDRVLETVRLNLLEGALLVIAVLFVFMGNLRAGLIVALAIPLSMLTAFNVMLQVGVVGSLMSLGAIDFGLVVDSSVIMVENAARRVEADTTGRRLLEIVRDAAVEVRKPTLFGELIIAAVYLPILTLEGIEGKLFRPMALTVIFALMASMLISVTLMPVLASFALKRRTRAPRENRFVQTSVRLYGAVLDGALRRKARVLFLAGLCVAAAWWPASRLGSEFVPRLREQSIVINTVRMAGISLDESIRYGTRLERILLETYPDEIARIWTRTGTAEVATDPMGLEVSDVFITLNPREGWTKAADQDQLMVAMAGTLEGMPGMRSIFTQPIEMRVNEMVAGIRADLGVKVFGPDFTVLAELAEEARSVVSAIDGAVDVTVEQLTGQTLLSIEVDREAAGRLGVPVGDILASIDSLGTRKLGEVFEGQRRFDLVLTLADARTPEAIGAIQIHTGTGARVPLSDVTEIRLSDGPSTINREWAERRIIVQANARGRDVGSFAAEVEEALKREVALPEGYHIELGGQFEHLVRAKARLMVVVPITLMIIFGLLYLTYGRVLDVLRIFTGVPFGAVGGIAALWLRDIPFSISAAVGFIALSGVSVLGDMVLVSRIKQHAAGGLEAIREAARTRFRPVLMTASVAALGFLPMALNTGIGAEVQRPLATVVIGGMISSTIGTLIVLPVLYAVMTKRR